MSTTCMLNNTETKEEIRERIKRKIKAQIRERAEQRIRTEPPKRTPVSSCDQAFADLLQTISLPKVPKTVSSSGLKAGDLAFPNFDDIVASTKTIITMLNVTLDIEKLFEFLPITKYVVVPKKRGRKKKNADPDPNIGIKSGSIITLEYGEKTRGVIKSKKVKKKSDDSQSTLSEFV